MDKKLELNGKTLLFGKAGFFDHIKDASGKDPLQWMNEMFERFKKTEDGKWEITAVIDEVVVYAYAGINLMNDVNDVDSLPIERVRRWVRTLSFEECGQIINAAVESMAGEKTNGEAKGEVVTQPVS